MSSKTQARLLQENGGDLSRAFAHACSTIDYLAGHVSVGKMRAGPVTDRAAKKHVEGIDVDHTASPHG